jgi:hypothetical protein
MDFKGFIGPAYSLKNYQYICQTTKNLTLEVIDGGPGKGAQPHQFTLRPGEALSVSSLAGISRGGYLSSTGTIFWIFGNTLYTVTDGTATSRGTLSGTTSKCFFTDNGTDLFIISGTSIYTAGLSSGAPTLQTTFYSSTASSCTFLDSYVIFTKPSSNQFFWSDLLSTSGDGDNFASAEANPDQVVAVFNNAQDLWVFGAKSIELWGSNSGAQTSADAFVRRGNLLIESGCASAASIKKIEQTLMWVSYDDRSTPSVVIAMGYNPTRVSTLALEQEWKRLGLDPTSATADVMHIGGHSLYLLNFTGASETYIYDYTASKMLGKSCWTTGSSFDGNGGFTRWNPQGIVVAGNTIFTGDFYSGSLLTLSLDYTTDYVSGVSQPIVWERTTPHISNEMKRIRHNSITIDCATGIAIDPTLDPQIMEQHSDDGGATWTDERWVSCGKIGQYGLRVKFYQLGSALSRVYRFRGSDNIAWALSGAAIEIDAGAF